MKSPALCWSFSSSLSSSGFSSFPPLCCLEWMAVQRTAKDASSCAGVLGLASKAQQEMSSLDYLRPSVFYSNHGQVFRSHSLFQPCVAPLLAFRNRHPLHCRVRIWSDHSVLERERKDDIVKENMLICSSSCPCVAQAIPVSLLMI